LCKHPWYVAKGIDRGVIQDLESIVINKLAIKRINKGESRDQQDTSDDQALSLPDAGTLAAFLAPFLFGRRRPAALTGRITGGHWLEFSGFS